MTWPGGLPLNPLDWPGGPFLQLYLALSVVTFLFLLVMRLVLRGDAGGGQPGGLNVVEQGYLAGGPERAADTVVVALLAAGAAEFQSTGKRVVVDAGGLPLPPHLEPFRGALAGSVEREQIQRALKPALAATRDALVRRGLVMAPGQLRRMAVLTWAVMLPLLLFGLVKEVVGPPGEPSAELTFVTFVLGAFLEATKPLRTPAGDAALKKLRHSNRRAARTPLPSELALAFALTGGAVLAGTAYAGYARTIPSGSTGSSGDSGGDSGGSSGDSGGGGGCGGCGGGGSSGE